MRAHVVVCLAAAAALASAAPSRPLAAAEPAPKALTGTAVAVAPIAHVSAVMELANGALFVSNTRGPQVALKDAAGAVRLIGAPGSGDGRYAQPGGFYRGADNTIQLMDHAGSRVLVWSPAGEFLRAFSAAERGVTRNFDGDADFDQLDVDGHAYHASMSFAGMTQHKTVIRLEPATQAKTTIASLTLPETKTVSGGDGMMLSRATIGSPADDWGVAADGRVAVVHASPYRVEWFAAVRTSGAAPASTLGPEIAVDTLPFTDADKRAWETAHQDQPKVGVSAIGSASGQASLPTRFADTKPPFVVGGVRVSPTGQVWVKRQTAFGATEDVFDVFDAAGARVRRVAVPAGSTLVGFGPQSVYMRTDTAGGEVLRRYRLQ